MFLEWNIKSIVLIINGSTVLWASGKYRHRRKGDSREGLDSPIYPCTFWLKIAGTSKACTCKDHAASIPYTRNRTFVRERFRREFTNSEADGNTFLSAKVSGDTHEITQVYRLTHWLIVRAYPRTCSCGLAMNEPWKRLSRLLSPGSARSRKAAAGMSCMPSLCSVVGQRPLQCFQSSLPTLM